MSCYVVNIPPIFDANVAHTLRTLLRPKLKRSMHGLRSSRAMCCVGMLFVFLISYILLSFAPAPHNIEIFVRQEAMYDSSYSPTRCPASQARGAPIMIIGAGLAGLSAASTLRSRGCQNVLVLEARDRIGGRVYTNHSMKVEVGAGWVHGSSQDNAIVQLSQKHKIKLHHVGGDSVYIGGALQMEMFGPDGNMMSGTQRKRAFFLMNRLLKMLDAINTGNFTLLPPLGVSADQLARLVSMHQYPTNVPLCKVLDQLMDIVPLTVWERQTVNWHLEVSFGGDSAADTCDLSSRYYDAEYQPVPGTDSVFADGYDQIPKALAQGLRIELGVDIVRISHNAHGVRVTSRDGRSWSGSAAIVTVPLGVLREHAIAFDPPLPHAKLAAWSRLKMGTLVRVALEFDKSFWRRDKYAAGIASKERGLWPVFISNWMVHKRHVLEFMVGGPRGEQVEKMSDTAIVDSILAHLQSLSVFRSPPRPPLPRPRKVLVTRWGQDKFSRGAYSYFPLNAELGDFVRAGAPVGRFLLFAGEHTSRRHYASTHGAVESGQREAFRLIRTLFP